MKVTKLARLTSKPLSDDAILASARSISVQELMRGSRQPAYYAFITTVYTAMGLDVLCLSWGDIFAVVGVEPGNAVARRAAVIAAYRGACWTPPDSICTGKGTAR